MRNLLTIKLEKLSSTTASSPAQAVVAKEFHVSRSARAKFSFDQWLFISRGHVIFANFRAAREFARKINDTRDLLSHPEQAVKAGQVNAMGLIDEILHHVITLYQQEINREVFAVALDWLQAQIGQKEVDKALHRFVEEFPPMAVHKGEVTGEKYLADTTDEVPNRQIVLEEMIMLWLANMNPAFSPLIELFDDGILAETTAYSEILKGLGPFFETQPRFGPENHTLIELLRVPAVKHPNSLQGQLNFMRKNWGLMLGKYMSRLIMGLDLIREESKALFFGPPPTEVADFGGMADEPERFSPDLDWMPRVVLIAKSTLVWLDQLSKKYQRHIYRLDQIPDEELDNLASWGFTGLWLIGIWQRSQASKTIKQLCGNPEAEASAYSLFDYDVASELGGYEALQNLKDRCWRRGIRLACDMVPNHTGVESKWLREHPDWFISLPCSPFPAYSFTGPNLSQDPRFGVFIDDKYYGRTDAAVVFKREDYWTGDVRYIYHGNDGTSMPWNDTAQLNFLNAEAREAVIQNVLKVARMFSIIRFDAAMTLSKRHYQRLWFPEPGSGGDIPSRSEYGLTAAEFHKAIPEEFWRQVVDRVAAEVPDTLLLAEAFWLMEGYFVRTLGMHRVYNSAFMNMLKNEENEKYRNTIKNTIEFNPEILKRYVNFMNNPDEETAEAQFGNGDKYFGVCVMLVTMPGLPMFGHGQLEGFSEKYGMEYRRAYRDEEVDWGLFQHHEQVIFPLLRKRYLFAEVENFLLYDFYTTDGYVNENVFAYTNRFGEERSLVIYNNRYSDAHGWIRTSAAYATKTGNHDDVKLIQRYLGDGLDLPDRQNEFCIFRDQVTGLEYIRSCSDLHDEGLYVELGAYQYHVFLDFRLAQDNEWGHYLQLTDHLNGRGVASVDEARVDFALSPLLAPFDELLNVEMLEEFVSHRVEDTDDGYLSHFEARYLKLLGQVESYSSGAGDKMLLLTEVSRTAEAILNLQRVEERFGVQKSYTYRAAIRFLKQRCEDDLPFWGILYGWLLVHKLGRIQDGTHPEERSRSWLDEWLLGKRIAGLHGALSGEEGQGWESRALVGILTSQQNWHLDNKPKRQMASRILNNLLNSQEVRDFLEVNRFEGVVWFNKERFEQLVWWLFAIAVVQITAQSDTIKYLVVKEISEVFGMVKKWLKAAEASGYKVEELLESLRAG